MGQWTAQFGDGIVAGPAHALDMFQVDEMASVNAQKSAARQLLFDFPDRERTEEIVDAVEHKCIMSVGMNCKNMLRPD